MLFTAIPLVVLFYMWGGQTMKWIRPVGAALSIFGLYALLHHVPWTAIWLGAPALGYGFELAFGYGEKSWIAKFDKQNDTETRLLYALWCSIAVVVAAILHHNWLALLGPGLIFGAYQVHAGSAPFKIFGKDFLYEDLWRSLSLAIAMCWALS